MSDDPQHPNEFPEEDTPPASPLASPLGDDQPQPAPAARYQPPADLRGDAKALHEELFHQRLADVLRDYRKYARFSQRQLAAASGVTQKTISSIESGSITDPWDTTLRQLAAALAKPSHMAYTNAQEVYTHLNEAKNFKPSPRQQAPMEVIILLDRLRAMSPRRRFVSFKMIMSILDHITDIVNLDE